MCDDLVEDSEMHMLECNTIIDEIDNEVDLNNVKYEDIFSDNIDDQVNITKTYEKILRIRNRMKHN